MNCPCDAHRVDALHNERDRGFTVPPDSTQADVVKPAGLHVSAMELSRTPPVMG